MDIEVLSLFPQYIEGPLQESILGRAIKKSLLRVRSVNIRDFSTRADRRVDDRPFGGGPGMVMMPGPVVAAIRACRKPNSHVIYLSPQGTKLTSDIAERLAKLPHIILLCGHYEGIDQRALNSEVDEQISIGDYVLTNGCIAALVLIDAMARFIPGVLGHEEAAAQDSFATGLLDHPQYTVPKVFEGQEVPEVLFSGNHSKISQWRADQARQQTMAKRPDVAKIYHEQRTLHLSSGSSRLHHLILSTQRFPESCRFYEKITGCPPFQDNARGIADFALHEATLTLTYSSTPADIATCLTFTASEELFCLATRWARKNDVCVGEVKEGRATLRDPDGRIIFLRYQQTLH